MIVKILFLTKLKTITKLIYCMKQIHHIWLTVYCKPEDIEDEIIENIRKFFPFSLEEQKMKINTVLVTGFDIIFFWVARMIMFGLKFTNEVPFKIFISQA